MTTIFLVPTSPIPQVFNISLSGTSYQLTIKWNTASACWVMDLADSSGNPLAQGLPLVTGGTLLEQLAYLGIAGDFIVQSANDPDLVPDFNSLGSTGQLYYQSPTP